MNVLEFVGPVSVSLDSSGITLKSAEKEVSLPLPVNLVSFYVAGGYAYWDLPVKDGEKPPRAVFYYKDSRLVLFTSEKGRAIFLYERGEEKLSRVFRREELRTLLEWIRNSLKASMVEELVLVKEDGKVSLRYGVQELNLDEISREQLFWGFEDYLRQRQKKVIDTKPLRVVIDGNWVVLLRKGDRLHPFARFRGAFDNILRFMAGL